MFQFHNGTIKNSPRTIVCSGMPTMFQFHNRTIKTIRSGVKNNLLNIVSIPQRFESTNIGYFIEMKFMRV